MRNRSPDRPRKALLAGVFFFVFREGSDVPLRRKRWFRFIRAFQVEFPLFFFLQNKFFGPFSGRWGRVWLPPPLSILWTENLFTVTLDLRFHSFSRLPLSVRSPPPPPYGEKIFAIPFLPVRRTPQGLAHEFELVPRRIFLLLSSPIGIH